MHFAFEANVDAFALEDLEDRRRHVLVLAANQPIAHLDDGDLAAEAPEHLAELEADVAAADDDEMLGDEVDVHHRAVGEERHVVEPGHGGNERAAADVDEDALGGEPVGPDA